MMKYVLCVILTLLFVSCVEYISVVDCENKHGMVDITAYGALPDGKTDCSSIINQIISGFSDEGGTIIIPEGDFLLSSPIVVDKDNVVIKGLGSGFRSNIDIKNDNLIGPGGGSKLIVNNTQAAIRVVADVKDVEICDMMITGGETLLGVGILMGNNVSSGRISNVVGINLHTCLKVVGTVGLNVSDCWFCEVNNSIHLTNGTDNKIVRCQLGAKPVGYTCRFVNESRLIVENNHIYPDGRSNVLMENCNSSQVERNNFKSYYVGILELSGNDNVIAENLFWLADALPGQLLDRSSDYGVVRISGNANRFIANTITCDWCVENPVTIRATEGVDNQFVDCYVTDLDSERVYLVNQYTSLMDCVDSDKIEIVEYE